MRFGVPYAQTNFIIHPSEDIKNWNLLPKLQSSKPKISEFSPPFSQPQFNQQTNHQPVRFERSDLCLWKSLKVAPNAGAVGGAKASGEEVVTARSLLVTLPKRSIVLYIFIHEYNNIYNIYSKININEWKLEVNGKDWNLALWTYAVHNSGASFQIKWWTCQGSELHPNCWSTLLSEVALAVLIFWEDARFGSLNLGCNIYGGFLK